MINKIINTVKHVVRVTHAKIREATKGRSPEWHRVRTEFLKNNTYCAACGNGKNLQVHHLQPFALNPELELDKDNLITLCESYGGKECHIHIGHSGSFKTFNINCKEDAFTVLHQPERWDEIVEKAKKNAQPL